MMSRRSIEKKNTDAAPSNILISTEDWYSSTTSSLPRPSHAEARENKGKAESEREGLFSS